MRICAREGCDKPVTSRRSDAIWHADACRKRVEREIAALDGIAPGVARSFWDGLRAVRRPQKADKARTGSKGVRQR